MITNQFIPKSVVIMKKTLRYLTMLTVFTLLAVSCSKTDTTFDQSLLTGKWQSGTLFYKYAADGTGATWDTSDNVTEAEAQVFTWTLEKDLLTQIHTLEIGGSVPKVYTVTELTATSLKYHDSFGVSSSFTKVGK
jgi:hypothetical protein